MTLQEVCKRLGKSESTLQNSFKRTQENLLKKGIVLTKEGIGKTAIYEITYLEDEKEKQGEQL